MNRDELARRVYAQAHLTGTFRLRSGQYSGEYFDKYLFEAEPTLLRPVAEALAGLLPDEVELVAGLELGGVPLATMISALTGLPARFVRKHAKEYGTCRLAEGGGVLGRRIAVIEDVITTGGQVIESCASLRAAGAQIVAVLCVIDRQSRGRERLEQHGLTLHSVFTADELGGGAPPIDR
jgi:orotate phosphoribosyltransferase